MKQLVEENAHERALARQQLLREREIILKEKKENWDCESVLSTYSNLYNHPKLISERKPDHIKLSLKTGIPKNVLGRGLTANALKMLDMETGVLDDE